MIRSRRLGLLVTAVLMPAACTTRVERIPVAPVVAQLSVERFLQAANSRDLEMMGRLFGTSDGAWMDTRDRVEVEIQMNLIASILQHEDYRIVRQEREPGRATPGTRVVVDLTIRGQAVRAIPFIVVQTSEGRWLVEQVDLEAVMRAR